MSDDKRDAVIRAASDFVKLCGYAVDVGADGKLGPYTFAYDPADGDDAFIALVLAVERLGKP